MLYAIRSVRSPGFRRGGVYFENEKWTLVEDLTPEQLNEPQLTCVPADDPEFVKKIGPLGFVNPELLPEGATDTPTQKLAAAQERVAELERLLSESSDADEEIARLTKALTKSGNDATRRTEERDAAESALKAEREKSTELNKKVVDAEAKIATLTKELKAAQEKPVPVPATPAPTPAPEPAKPATTGTAAKGGAA